MAKEEISAHRCTVCGGELTDIGGQCYQCRRCGLKQFVSLAAQTAPEIEVK